MFAFRHGGGISFSLLLYTNKWSFFRPQYSTVLLNVCLPFGLEEDDAVRSESSRNLWCWSLNEDLEGMNYRCQNQSSLLSGPTCTVNSLAKALISSEVALFATGLTRREISSPCLEVLSILSIGLDEFSSIAAKFPQSCWCSNRLHLNIFLLVVSIILHKFSRLIIPLCCMILPTCCNERINSRTYFVDCCV